MKKFFKLFSILALAAVGAAAVGVATSSPKVESAEAASTVTGGIYLDFSSVNYDNDNDKIGVYFWNSSTNGWGPLMATKAGTHTYIYEYSLSFAPDNMIIARFKSSKTGSADWNDIDNQTVDLGFGQKAKITSWSGGTDGKSTAEVYSFRIHSSHDSGWTDTEPYRLSDVKINGLGHVEVYRTISMKSGEEFGVQVNGSGWYANYTDDGSGFTKPGTNIVCPKDGTYSFYYDTDKDQSENPLYITDAVKADADEWSQAFMAGGCTTATTGTKAKWGAHASSYAALVTKYGSSFSSIFENAAHVDHKDTASGYVGEAMQRYDYVLELYGVNDANTDALGYQDFIGRVSANKVTPGIYKSNVLNLFGTNDSADMTLAIVVISLVSVSAVAGVYFIRKRKHN